MPGYLFIHPVLSATAIVLILAAYAMKAGSKKRQMPHYIAGAAAAVMLTTTIIVGLWAVARRFNEMGGADPFPPVIQAHLIVGFIVLGLLLVQAGMGIAMRLSVYNIGRLLRYHRAVAPILVITTVIQAGLGMLTLIGLLRGLMAPTMLTTGLAIGLAVLVVPVSLLMLRSWQAFRQQGSQIDERHVVLPDDSAPSANVDYLPDELSVRTTTRRTILQTSLQAGIPHTHVCGGNARCSTCRVLVVDGYDRLEPRNRNEQMLAERLRFDPAIRLACQTRLTGDVKVRRLVLDEEDIAFTSQISRAGSRGPIGVERELAVLFSDIRGFTSFAENLLPYDVIHSLNRYYFRMDQAIAEHGGVINNYMGDGFMALFGWEEATDNPTRDAVHAGLAMLRALSDIRPYFLANYGRMLDIGIGVHVGTVVVGNLGAPSSQRMTAIGDTVNFASRVESANKDAGTRFLISEAAYMRIRDQVNTGRHLELPIKGKTGSHTLYEVVGLARPQSAVGL